MSKKKDKPNPTEKSLSVKDIARAREADAARQAAEAAASIRPAPKAKAVSPAAAGVGVAQDAPVAEARAREKFEAKAREEVAAKQQQILGQAKDGSAKPAPKAAAVDLTFKNMTPEEKIEAMKRGFSAPEYKPAMAIIKFVGAKLPELLGFVDKKDPWSAVSNITKAINDDPKLILSNINGLKEIVAHLVHFPNQEMSGAIDKAIISCFPIMSPQDKEIVLHSIIDKYNEQWDRFSFIINAEKYLPQIIDGEWRDAIKGNAKDIFGMVIAKIESNPEIFRGNPNGLKWLTFGAKNYLDKHPGDAIKAALYKATTALMPGLDAETKVYVMTNVCTEPGQREMLHLIDSMLKNFPEVAKIKGLIVADNPQMIKDNIIEALQVSPQILLKDTKKLKESLKAVKAVHDQRMQGNPRGDNSLFEAFEGAVASVVSNMEWKDKEPLMEAVYPEQKSLLSAIKSMRDNFSEVREMPEVIMGSDPKGIVEGILSTMHSRPEIFQNKPGALNDFISDIKSHLRHSADERLSGALDKTLSSLLPNIEWKNKVDLIDCSYPEQWYELHLVKLMMENFPEVKGSAGVVRGSHPKDIVGSIIEAMNTSPAIFQNNPQGTTQLLKGIGYTGARMARWHQSHQKTPETPDDTVRGTIKAVKEAVANSLPGMEWEARESLMHNLYLGKWDAFNFIKLMRDSFPGVKEIPGVARGNNPMEIVGSIIEAMHINPEIFHSNHKALQEAMRLIDRHTKGHGEDDSKIAEDKKLKEDLNRGIASTLPGMEWEARESLMYNLYSGKWHILDFIKLMRKSFPEVKEIPGVARGNNPMEIVGSIIEAMHINPEIFQSHPKQLQGAIKFVDNLIDIYKLQQEDTNKWTQFEKLKEDLNGGIVSLLPGMPVDGKLPLMHKTHSKQYPSLRFAELMLQKFPDTAGIRGLSQASDPEMIENAIIEAVSNHPQILLKNEKGLVQSIKYIIKNIKSTSVNEPALRRYEETLHRAAIQLFPEMTHDQKMGVLHLLYPEKGIIVDDISTLLDVFVDQKLKACIVDPSDPEVIMQNIMNTIKANPITLESAYAVLSAGKALEPATPAAALKWLSEQAWNELDEKRAGYLKDLREAAVPILIRMDKLPERRDLEMQIFPDRAIEIKDLYTILEAFPSLSRQEYIATDIMHPETRFAKALDEITRDSTVLLNSASPAHALQLLKSNLSPQNQDTYNILHDLALNSISSMSEQNQFDLRAISYNNQNKALSASAAAAPTPPQPLDNALLEILTRAGNGLGATLGERWDSVQSKLSSNFKGELDSPSKRIAALFIDGKMQKGNSREWIENYDKREEGCLQSMHKAYNNFVQKRQESKTLGADKAAADLFFGINTDAMSWKGGGEEKGKEIAFAAGHDVKAPLATGSAIGHEGRLLNAREFEFLRSEERLAVYGKSPMWSLEVDISAKDPLHLLFHARSTEDIKSYTQNILNTYYQALETAPDLQTKLYLLAETYGRVERLHPKRDGNTRTSNIWMNTELMNMGLPPTILHNPNKVSSQTPEEVVQDIIFGMRRSCKEMGIDIGQVYGLEVLATVAPDEVKADVPLVKDVVHDKALEAGRILLAAGAGVASNLKAEVGVAAAAPSPSPPPSPRGIDQSTLDAALMVTRSLDGEVIGVAAKPPTDFPSPGARRGSVSSRGNGFNKG